MERIASHDGIVVGVKKNLVEVQIHSVSACAACAAHGKCGFADAKDKRIEVPSARWQDYSEGQPVVVHIDESRGMLAVWIAYVLPALLMLAAIIGLSLAGWPEWAVVLSGFVVLGVYIAALYLFRQRVGDKFVLTVE